MFDDGYDTYCLDLISKSSTDTADIKLKRLAESCACHLETARRSLKPVRKNRSY